MNKIKLKDLSSNLTLFAFISIFIFISLCWLKSCTPDSDTFFLIATGKNIVETGKVATINPFTFHENFEIIIQQWLFDVMLYKIYDILGFFGIFLYSAIMYLISIGAFYKFLGLYSKDTKLKAFCLIFFILFYSCTSRPTSISFLMCLSTVAILKKVKDENSNKLLFFLPFISFVTINIHSAMWLMLFVLIIPFIFPNEIPKNIKTYMTKWFNDNKFILLSIIIMFFLGFANPNGINGILYTVKSYGAANLHNMIEELKVPTIFSSFGMLIVFTIIFLVLYVVKYKTKMNFSLFYMACGTIILAMMHKRNYWFLFFSVFPLFLILFKDVKIPNMFPKKSEKKSGQIISIVISTILIIGFILTPFLVGDIILTDKELQPVLAVEYLNNLDKADIVLFTEFNNGAFFEFYGYKVYIDARPEIYQSGINNKEDIYTEYTEMIIYGENIKEFLNKYNFTHLVVSNGSSLYGYLDASESYKAVVKGNEYKLFEKCN